MYTPDTPHNTRTARTHTHAHTCATKRRLRRGTHAATAHAARTAARTAALLATCTAARSAVARPPLPAPLDGLVGTDRGVDVSGGLVLW